MYHCGNSQKKKRNIAAVLARRSLDHNTSLICGKMAFSKLLLRSVLLRRWWWCLPRKWWIGYFGVRFWIFEKLVLVSFFTEEASLYDLISEFPSSYSFFWLCLQLQLSETRRMHSQ
eukprot:TRINITY_DN135389_c0_g1_i1.p2 TRINITY_DN135389_c0_g1~~TRINITY_DN135389_c0_g1_i1.p2  ORF type:complete len:116 (+),score=7.22 TRINITY_DN135389_c0_g1_i1:147-494(+)